MNPHLKTILNILWRLAAILAGAAVLAVGIVVLVEYYQYKKGLDGNAYVYPEVADGVRSVRMNDHTSRLYRPEQDKYLTPRYAWISGRDMEGEDSLIVFCPEVIDRLGYLNAKNGKVALPPRYERAWDFSEGCAFVVDRGRLSVIGPNGEVRFRMPGMFPKKNVVILNLMYRGGLAAVPDSAGRYGIIDRRGAWVLEPAYTEIGMPCGEGWRIVCDGDRYGLMAPDLTLSIPLDYGFIKFAKDGVSVFALKDGLCKRLAFDGKVLTDCVVEETFPLHYSAYDPEPNETISVLSEKFLKFEAGGHYGVLSRKSGKVILPARYESIELLSPTLIAASLESRRQIVYDAQGRLVDNR